MSFVYFQITLICAVDIGHRLLIVVSLQFIGQVIDCCLKVTLFGIDHDEDFVCHTGLEKFTRIVYALE